MGQEFLVNSYQSNWQRDPDVIATTDGGYLIVWESYFNDYDDGAVTTYVAGQRYDASGARIGGEIVLDGVDGSNSSTARVTALTDGGFVMVWTYDNYDAILSWESHVYAQVFNANGTARSLAVEVDTVASTNAVLPEAIALANGGFIVQFGADRSTTLFDQIYRQQFTSAGVKLGGNQLVNTAVGDFDQIYVRSAKLINGTSVTIWNSEGSFEVPGSTLDSNEIRGTIYRANGTVQRGDFSLSWNIGTAGGNSGAGYDVAALQSGGFVVSHLAYAHDLGLNTPEKSYYMIMRFFNAAGTAVSGPKIIFGGDDLSNGTRIVQLANGQILVVWSQDPMQAQISDDVYGRLFSANGTATTGVFEISVDSDSYDEQTSPEVAALAGGGFVVTYQSDSIDADDEGIAGRVFGRGTGGADTLAVDVTGMMAGLGGNDGLTGNAGANGLYGGIGNDRLTGNNGHDTLDGGAGNDSLTAGEGNDVLAGGASQDQLFGGLGKDILKGADGADVLNGGAGVDRLTGGSGADHFVFATAPGARHRDVVTDFAAADSLYLEHDIYSNAGRLGTLAAHRFKVLANAAVDASDRVLYDRATGAVYFDADGSGAGGRQVIAVLENRPALTYADVILF